ncbi:hypothetical protein [Bosea sp. R86505]|uniref:hypothetical protein n=1 Tax=Bosea sp. R86505 TaxID=3101710 RepID=UPI00366B2C6A
MHRTDLSDAWVFAGVVTVLVAVIWAAAYMAMGRTPVPAGLGFDGQPIRDGTINPVGQLLAYQLALASLGGVVIAAVVWPGFVKGWRRSFRPESSGLVIAVASLSGAAALAWAIGAFAVPKMPTDTVIPPFAQWYSILSLPSKTFYVGSVTASAVVLAVVVRFGAKIGQDWLWGLSLLLILALTLPGLFEPVTLVQIPSGTLQGVEAHFTGVIGSNPAGSFEIDRPVGYSLLVTLVKVAYEQSAGPMSFLQEVRSVQVGNLAFALACMFACRVWSPRQALTGFMIILLIMPWVHNNHQGLFFPNQAGWRFLTFPLLVIVIAVSRFMTSLSRSAVLGAFAGLALLWNLETGIAVTVAIVTFIGCRTMLWREAAAAALAAIASGILAMAMALLFTFPLAGLTSLSDAAWVVQGYFGRLAVGDGYGLPLAFDSLAIIMALYAIWSVALAAFRLGDGVLSEEAASYAAVAAAMLVWGAYYAARPDPWNLWSYLFFFGLLLSAGLSADARRWAGRSYGVPGLSAFAFILVVGPAIAAGQYQALRTVSSGLSGIWEEPAGSAYVDGVRLPTADAARLARQAEEVRLATEGTLVLTGNSHLLPKLSGRPELFLEKDPVFAHAYQDDYRSLLAIIMKRTPRRILIDDPASLPTGSTHQRFFMALQKDLSASFSGEVIPSGWVDLRPRVPPA